MELLPLAGAILLGILGTLGAQVLWARGKRGGLASWGPLEGLAQGFQRTSADSTSPEPFDAVAAAQELLRSEEELRGLYERLGFSLDLEEKAQTLLEEIKAAVEVEIPDYDAFRRSVEGAVRELAGGGGDDGRADALGPLGKARRSRAADPLLAAVASARDEGEALAALRRAPVDEVLPFVEEVPLLRGGSVVWRTPMGLDVLHKGAADPSKMLRRIEELAQRVEASSLRRQPRAKAELLKAAAALVQALEGGQTYLVTPIKTLEAKLAEWYLDPEDSAARQRRRQLDEILLSLVALRHEVFAEPPAEASAINLRERATALAQGYVSSPAIEAPRLSQLLLEPLLAAEAAVAAVAALARGPKPPPPEDPAQLLLTVASEVRSGRFDGEETLRRLRSLEPRGLFVHSLVYRLLRMASPRLERGNVPRRESPIL